MNAARGVVNGAMWRDLAKDAAEVYGADTPEGNAVRHASFAAIIAYNIGDAHALVLLEGHENFVRNSELDTAVDRFNNEVGIQLGVRASNEGWSEDEVLEAVIDLLNDGFLGCDSAGEVGRC